MPALSVAALVISHRQPEYLRQTLEGLLAQTNKPQQIMVVETAADADSLAIARDLGVSLITPGDLKLGAAIEAGRAALGEIPGWLWILHEDSRPEPTALENMTKAAEISPSVAIIGPKLLRWEDPIRIQQLGLTLTPSGRPFLLVQDEYDQGQHDANGDVLAVSTAGMLISNALWQELGGLHDSTPVFAQDLELGLKARAKGYRVIVESSARVHHAGLSMAGARPRSWIGGTRLEGLARAHVHLATALWPMPLVVLLYVFMPLIVLANVPLNLLAKKPKRIFSQLLGWIWAWGTLSSRFAARRELQSAGSLKGAKALFAKPAQIRRRKLSELVEEPEPETPVLSGLFASNQAWFALFPLLASFAMWPAGALYGERLLPLSDRFSKVFANVSAMYVQRGDGLVAPTDPYNWFLALVAGISPLGPSFGLAAFVFVAPAFAFFTSWKLVGVFSAKPWARTIAALAYAMSPLVFGSAQRGEVVELTALVFAPLAAFLLVKALVSFNPARAWRWTGLAGLALAVVAVSSPLLAGLLTLVSVVGFAFYYRRALIVIWAFVPAGVILYPWAEFWLNAGKPELLTSTSWAAAEPLQIFGPGLLPFIGACVALGLLGFFLADADKALILGSTAAVSLLVAWYQPVSSASPLLGFGLLLLLAAFAAGFDSFNKVAKVVASAAALSLVVAQAALLLATNPNLVSFGNERQMPALIVAQSNVDKGIVQTLKITANADSVDAELVWGDGLFLEEQSLAARYLKPELDSQPLAALAGSLIAGNPQGVQDLLDQAGVGFVLLTSPDANLLAQLEVGVSSMEFLQPAGKSEFGLLWQTGVPAKPAPQGLGEHPYRELQLGLLAAFVLLALPTPAAIRGSRRAYRGER
jgi:GT2 family glycosyltransferase